MMSLRFVLFGFCLIGLLLLGSGCASVSIQDVEKTPALAPKVAPKVFYVKDFSTEDADFRVNRSGEELKRFKEATSKMMSRALVKRIQKKLGVVHQLNPRQPLPRSGWLITGEYLRVNQGSRALRATIGFGAGGTKMETLTKIYDLSVSSTEPFLTFETTGGSNAEPGILLNAVDPISLIGAGIGALGGAAKGITEDTNRTSRMILAEITHYMYQQGWIDKSKLMNPKWKGKFSPILAK